MMKAPFHEDLEKQMGEKEAIKYLTQVYLSRKDGSYREALSVALAAMREKQKHDQTTAS